MSHEISVSSSRFVKSTYPQTASHHTQKLFKVSAAATNYSSPNQKLRPCKRRPSHWDCLFSYFPSLGQPSSFVLLLFLSLPKIIVFFLQLTLVT